MSDDKPFPVELFKGPRALGLTDKGPEPTDAEKLATALAEVSRLRGLLYEANKANAKLNEQNTLLEGRRKQLEQIVQSSFARSVKGLSGDRPAAQAEASKVIAIVEDHHRAERLLTKHEVPHASVEGGIGWLIGIHVAARNVKAATIIGDHRGARTIEATAEAPALPPKVSEP